MTETPRGENLSLGSGSFDDVDSAKKTIMKIVVNAEFLSTRAHHAVKSVQIVVRNSSLLDNFEKNTKTLKHILRHFQKGDEQEFYRKSIPALLTGCGIEKTSKTYKIATSGIAGKTAALLKPIAFSLLSFYVRHNQNKIPTDNPFKLIQYPSLLESDSKSYDEELIAPTQKNSGTNAGVLDRLQDCCGDAMDFVSNTGEEAFDQIYWVTTTFSETVENKVVDLLNKGIASVAPSDEEYANLRKVLLQKNGIKKLYNKIFPHESKVKEATSLESKEEVENFVKKTFSKDKSKNDRCVTM
jgi:hypothetical protein